MMHAAGFSDVSTIVERGLERDTGDHYFPRLKEMDPVFALAASKGK
jgi:hypothetical protein